MAFEVKHFQPVMAQPAPITKMSRLWLLDAKYGNTQAAGTQKIKHDTKKYKTTKSIEWNLIPEYRTKHSGKTVLKNSPKKM